MPSLAGTTQARCPLVSHMAFWGSRAFVPSTSVTAGARIFGENVIVALPSTLRTMTAFCSVAVGSAPMRLPSAFSATGAEASCTASEAACFAAAVEIVGCVMVDLSTSLRWSARAAVAVARRIARGEIEWPLRAGEIVVLPLAMLTVALCAGSAIRRRFAGMRGCTGVAIVGAMSDE